MFEAICVNKVFAKIPTGNSWAFDFEVKGPDTGIFTLYYSNEYAFTVGNTYSFGMVVEE